MTSLFLFSKNNTFIFFIRRLRRNPNCDNNQTISQLPLPNQRSQLPLPDQRQKSSQKFQKPRFHKNPNLHHKTFDHRLQHTKTLNQKRLRLMTQWAHASIVIREEKDLLKADFKEEGQKMNLLCFKNLTEHTCSPRHQKSCGDLRSSN